MGRLVIDDAAAFLYKAIQEYSLTVLHENPANRPKWEEAPKELKGLAYQSMLRMMRNPEMTVEQNHAMFAYNAMLGGWRFGEEYDPFRKLNPRLKPFRELSGAQKSKSDLAISVFRLFKGRLPAADRNGVVNHFYGDVRELVQFG